MNKLILYLDEDFERGGPAFAVGSPLLYLPYEEIVYGNCWKPLQSVQPPLLLLIGLSGTLRRCHKGWQVISPPHILPSMVWPVNKEVLD